jgi:hypothetical protein
MAAHKSRHADPLIAVFSFEAKPGKLGVDHLRFVDIDGKVVRAIKMEDGGGSSRKISGPRLYDLIRVPDGHSGAWVIDPAIGEVLRTRSRLMVSPDQLDQWRDDTDRRPNFTFCFGRAILSGEYKLVCLVDGVSCQVLNVRDGLGWKPAPPPPTRVSHGWNFFFEC